MGRVLEQRSTVRVGVLIGVPIPSLNIQARLIRAWEGEGVKYHVIVGLDFAILKDPE